MPIVPSHSSKPVARGLAGLVLLFPGMLLAQESVSQARGEGPQATPAFSIGPRFFKGNLHTHSLWSDGNDFPEMIADWYARKGYHFLALSDHNILSNVDKWLDVDVVAKRAPKAMAKARKRFGAKHLITRARQGKTYVRLRRLDEVRRLVERPGRFVMIQGEEITDIAHGRFHVHINASNVAELIRPQHGGSVRDVMRRNLAAVAEQSKRLDRPILAHLNHPNFHFSVTAEDLAHVTEERFFEVFNGHRGVHQLGDRRHASVERIWDIANTLRVAELGAPPLMGLATDDSHQYFGGKTSVPGRGWIMVDADAVEPSAIVRAIQAGRFYASTGVRLSRVAYDGARLDIEIAGGASSEYETLFVGTRRGFDRRSEIVRDSRGNPVRTTRRYSQDVGQVLARRIGRRVSYRLRGDELYVRAIVTSTRRHPDPAFGDQRQQAWIQPVTR